MVRLGAHTIEVLLVAVLAMSACGDNNADVEASSGDAATPPICDTVMAAVTDGRTPAEVAGMLRDAPDGDPGLADALLRLDAGETMTDSDREAFAAFRDECSDAFERAAAARERAEAGADDVEVLVVDQPVPAGTDGFSAVANGLLRLDRMPREFTPDDAVVDPASLIGLVTAVALAPGQVVTAEVFEPA